MSLREPRCLVCGVLLSMGTPFEKNISNSEVCSDKCYEIYMFNEGDNSSYAKRPARVTSTLAPVSEYRCHCEPTPTRRFT